MFLEKWFLQIRAQIFKFWKIQLQANITVRFSI